LQVAKWLASVEPGMIHVRGVVCVACLTQHATHS
jgi:hypothetical protein